MMSSFLSFVYRALLNSNIFQAGHFTLDNASNNQTMMEALERKLDERDIPFDAKGRRIMCYH
jgi:hypothetical protein